MDSKQIEATPSVAAIEGKTKDPQYLNSLERERNTFKQVYYLWLARFFIVLASFSMLFFVLASLSLFHLAPSVTVDPLLLVNQNDSTDAVLIVDPIARLAFARTSALSGMHGEGAAGVNLPRTRAPRS